MVLSFKLKKFLGTRKQIITVSTYKVMLMVLVKLLNIMVSFKRLLK
ncbi:hypothetical protein RDI58_002263 [Solanum bulbocastanum]|uniref:Uncharacterized protein n=1 Tax=Solanum bulbocastanum TaxID=147425 RepID=A0AAN8YQY3_SOLBU